jgi:hypothetical protein
MDLARRCGTNAVETRSVHLIDHTATLVGWLSLTTR